jgi:hypothetical protein
MAVYNIGPNALQISGFGAQSDQITIQNSGTVSVFVSANANVSDTVFDYKIDPSGTIQWPAGAGLYVCTGPNLAGQINLGPT